MSGSVRHVGPSEIGYALLTQRTPSPSLKNKTIRPSFGGPIHDTLLLKSGVGARHVGVEFAGQPGQHRGSNRDRSTKDILINGRRRRLRPEPLPEDQAVPTGPTVIGP